jgi:hypothetical protein
MFDAGVSVGCKMTYPFALGIWFDADGPLRIFAEDECLHRLPAGPAGVFSCRIVGGFGETAVSFFESIMMKTGSSSVFRPFPQ